MSTGNNMQGVKGLLIANMVISLAALAVGLYNWYSAPRIGYVHNSKVMAEYEGVKEGQRLFEKKLESWQGQLDTLQVELDAMIKTYESQASGMNERERKLSQDLIRQKQSQVVSYKTAIGQQAEEAERELTGQIIRQIDGHLLEYGKTSGYDYIFGVTDNGSILYARDGSDLTEAVLKDLNSKYGGN